MESFSAFSRSHQPRFCGQGFARQGCTERRESWRGSLLIKVAATLLKALVHFSGSQIVAFAAVLALRTLLKRLFAWEAARFSRPGTQP